MSAPPAGRRAQRRQLLIAVKDAKKYCAVYEPEEAEVTVFETGDFWSNTIRIRPLGSTAEPQTIYSSDKFRAEAIFRGDRMYFRTNRHAPKWKLMAASYAKPEFADWTTLIAEQPSVLADVPVTRAWIVAAMREDVLSRLALYDIDGKAVRELPLPEFGNVVGNRLRRRCRYAATRRSPRSPRRQGVCACDGKALAWKLVWQDDPPLDRRRSSPSGCTFPRRTARRFRCSSCTGRT